jgi:hypothetical protein
MGIQQSVEEGNNFAYFSRPFGSDKHSTCSSQSYYYLMQILIKFHDIVILYEVERSYTFCVYVCCIAVSSNRLMYHKIATPMMFHIMRIIKSHKFYFNLVI